MIFKVKTTWAFGDTGIELLEVNGTSNHHDAIVAFQSVHFVQKEAPRTFRDHAVKVLEYKETWGHFARFFEDPTDGVDGVAFDIFDIECWYAMVGPVS